MIQWSLAAFGPIGIAAAVIITVAGIGLAVDEFDTTVDPVWDDGDSPGSSEDGSTEITHSFRYWDFDARFYASDGTSFSEEYVENAFMQYYNLYGSTQYVSLEEHLSHIPDGLEDMSKEFLTSLWAMTWGTWSEAEDDEIYLPGTGGVTIDESDDEDAGSTIVLPGIDTGTSNSDEVVDGTVEETPFQYRTEPTVQYVSDYIYDYAYIYQYVYPNPEPDLDFFQTDGDFTVSYFQEDYFDWGMYFLILFPVLAAEILIFNRFRHPKVVS